LDIFIISPSGRTVLASLGREQVRKLPAPMGAWTHARVVRASLNPEKYAFSALFLFLFPCSYARIGLKT
jgi:hypothetical protein